MPPTSDAFWEQPDVVARFMQRAPDHRLLALLPGYALPEDIRVLDLGCAGGRNTVLLVERGFDVYAMDASAAMVGATRGRVAALLGEAEADRRVLHGAMDDLSVFDDGAFDLVVALGIYHNAHSRAEWDRTLAETARVLRPGGELLVAQFTPRTRLTEEDVRPVPGEPDVYTGFPGGRAVLFEADALDADLARYGLVPVVPSATVDVETDVGRRVTVNAHYRKSAVPS